MTRRAVKDHGQESPKRTQGTGPDSSAVDPGLPPGGPVDRPRTVRPGSNPGKGCDSSPRTLGEIPAPIRTETRDRAFGMSAVRIPVREAEPIVQTERLSPLPLSADRSPCLPPRTAGLAHILHEAFYSERCKQAIFGLIPAKKVSGKKVPDTFLPLTFFAGKFASGPEPSALPPPSLRSFVQYAG